MKGLLLLIDDDADDRELFGEAMEDIASDILCLAVGSGTEAMNLLDIGEVKLPDVIFLDINMPLLSGWEFLSQLKGHDTYGTIPVVMYSTSSHEKEKKMAEQAGALGLLTKPNNYQTLKTILKVIVQHIRTDSLPEFNINSLEI